jgi:sec-independent protein translocase protein TatA
MIDTGRCSAPPAEVAMFEGLFQPMHLLLILGIALIFFGPSKLPELGKGLGTSLRDFKKAMNGEDDEPKRLDEGNGADRDREP